MTLAEFNRRFRIVPTSLWNWPRDLSKAGPDEPLGDDCQTYARTVAAIEGVRFPRAIMVRCWSPQNLRKFPFVPRHAVMWIKGKGFIDSSRREYRKTPWPHIPAWPVGAPLVAFLLMLASPLLAQDSAFWQATGCTLVPIQGAAWVAELRCQNFLTEMTPPVVTADLHIDGLAVHLSLAQTFGREPDSFAVTPPDGFVAIPPVLVLDEEARGVVQIMEYLGF
jgi:hypothetical protein